MVKIIALLFVLFVLLYFFSITPISSCSLCNILYLPHSLSQNPVYMTGRTFIWALRPDCESKLTLHCFYFIIITVTATVNLSFYFVITHAH